MAPITVDLFGDPTCPWDFSAEPARLRMMWRHGDALDVRRHMVVLAEDAGAPDRRGITLDDLAAAYARIRDLHGMPIRSRRPPRHTASIVACRAVVAVRLHAPAREEVFLRTLRVMGLSEGHLIDEPGTLDRAADRTGIARADLRRWVADPATEEALREDMRAARSPGPAARAMRARLAATEDGGLRYTCPTWRMRGGGTSLEIPGFQPVRVYEVAAANLAPQVSPRDEPASVAEVLAWAPYPLATVEVAAIMGVGAGEARALLCAAAREHPAAGDSYWSAGP